ncbi:MAG: hypothetical protein O3B08_03575 [Proteobacteria bacterium]|nr:hypothetical protein [Pseudomonadota bacterium]
MVTLTANKTEGAQSRRARDVALTGGNLGAYNIEELRLMAKKRLPRGIFEYVDRGAEDEIALHHNRAV